MKQEYDFSKGVRANFYRCHAQFNLPAYLVEWLWQNVDIC
jgi:hypothetical protein